MRISHTLRVALTTIAWGISNVSGHSIAVAATQSCELTQTVLTETQFSSELLDEASIIAGDVRPLELVARFIDVDGDGVREVLALQGAGTIVIRNGVTLETINLGAFPFTLPSGAVPTQMSTIGDLERDGAEEVAIGVRYVGSARAQSVFVFRGSNLQLLQQYPSTLGDLTQRIDTQEPRYPNPPRVSLIGVSAQVANIGGRRQIVYIDPNVNGGTVVFKTACTRLFPVISSYECFDTRTLQGSTVAPRNLGVKSVGFEAVPGGPRTVYLGDPSADSLPLGIPGIVDFRRNLSGAIGKLENGVLSVYRRGNSANLRLGFDLAVAASIAGQNALLASAPTDGISPTDTSEFLVLGLADPAFVRPFSPQLSEENIDFGYAIDGGDDLTGDGVSDVAIGAPGENNQGRVRIYSPELDYFNRSILQIAGGTIRFGHSLASVGPGRLVVADATGKLYALAVSGARTGAIDAISCAPKVVNPTPTPVTPVLVDNSALDVLRERAARISVLLGSLKFQQGRVGGNRALLDAIKTQTNRVSASLVLPTVSQREPRFNAGYTADFKKRADTLQKRFRSGNRTKRRDAQKRLTAKANEIVRLSSAARLR